VSNVGLLNDSGFGFAHLYEAWNIVCISALDPCSIAPTAGCRPVVIHPVPNHQTCFRQQSTMRNRQAEGLSAQAEGLSAQAEGRRLLGRQCGRTNGGRGTVSMRHPP
jgi:hypothetical protein